MSKMKKEKWLIYYHHSFCGDIVDGTFADAVRAGIRRIEEDFEDQPLVVKTAFGFPGTEDYREEIISFDNPLDVINKIERYSPDEEEE
jgi:hypothetical protein